MSTDLALPMATMRRCCDHLLVAAVHVQHPTTCCGMISATDDGQFSETGLPVMAGAAAKVGRKP